MAWLLRDDGRVLATLEVAESIPQRMRGLLGRDSINGALLLPGVRSVHTIGMRFAIDVAYLDRGWRVVSMSTLVPYRLGVPCLTARRAVEAEAGSFERWGLRKGDVLEVREAPGPGSEVPGPGG